MFIKCKNITDFNWLMSSALLNEDRNARLFIPYKDSLPPVSLQGDKCNISFTYAFFSSLYTVVYEDNASKKAYDDIYKSLDCARHNFDLRIQIFDELSLNKEKTFLNIGREIEYR